MDRAVPPYVHAVNLAAVVLHLDPEHLHPENCELANDVIEAALRRLLADLAAQSPTEEAAMYSRLLARIQAEQPAATAAS